MKARGFTLLEALVTLVIVAMVATLLMQSLFQVLGLRERVLRAEQEARVSALQERWFREAVAAAVADLPDGAAPFAGDARGIRFQSLDPPGAQRFAIVEWRLRDAPGGVVLDLATDPEEVPVPILQVRRAEFRYLDAGGTWHPVWPPALEPGAPAVRDDRALPRAVELTMDADRGPHSWRVDLGAGPRLPLPLRVTTEIARGSL